MSISLRELPDVAAAVAQALDLAEEHLRSRPPASPRHQPRDDRGRRGPDSRLLIRATP